MGFAVVNRDSRVLRDGLQRFVGLETKAVASESVGFGRQEPFRGRIHRAPTRQAVANLVVPCRTRRVQIVI
jgi:hypothetical protein